MTTLSAGALLVRLIESWLEDDSSLHDTPVTTGVTVKPQ